MRVNSSPVKGGVKTQKQSQNRSHGKKSIRAKSAEVLDISFGGHIDEKSLKQSELQSYKKNNNEDPKVSNRSSTKDGHNCLICCDSQADSVLMECGHGGICFTCGIALCINTYE